VVNPLVIPSVNISSSANSICRDKQVTFSAASVNGGTQPSYQWKINSNIVGDNTAKYVSSSLLNGDVVTCTMTSNAACASIANVVSNSLVMEVKQPLTPAVSISSSANNICNATAVSFTALSENGGAAPLYQWKINGVKTGANDPVYTSANLANGDVVSCSITSSLSCVTNSFGISNLITMSVKPQVIPSIKISASKNTICKGDPVTFFASTINAGTAASYQWKRNGTDVGTNSGVYTGNNFSDNDQVYCILKPSPENCSTEPVSSNIEKIIINPLPKITVYPSDTTILAGYQVRFDVAVSGAISSYVWQPSTSLSDPLSLSPVTIPLTQSTDYLFKALSKDGCEIDKQSYIKVITNFYMPNAFSPNEDNVNKEFKIPRNTLVSLTDFSIFNRFGAKVFSTRDMNKGWDGKVNNIAQPAGAYVYIINGTGSKGVIFFKGTVMLIR
jgi:gliding motility-associated-like protein